MSWGPTGEWVVARTTMSAEDRTKYAELLRGVLEGEEEDVVECLLRAIDREAKEARFWRKSAKDWKERLD